MKSAVRIKLRKLSESCDEERSVHTWNPSSRRHVRGATKSLFQDLRHIPASLPSKFRNDLPHLKRPITPTNCKNFELYIVPFTSHCDLYTLDLKCRLSLEVTRWVHSKSKRFMNNLLEQSITNVSYQVLGIGFDCY